MEGLVEVINKLQQVTSLLGQEALSLPQIVVVGDQSSGKSSVLESLVGQSFLPRATGIATRCPVILQLVQLHSNRVNDVCDYGVFAHNKDKVYTNFDEIRDELLAETMRKAGPNKDIHPEPIILKIFSGKVSTLTMIDLPGIVKVPVGDQPIDVEDKVKELILKYISNSNSIILAVLTATTDIATCESLKIAKEVDPNLDRTIVVVTKLDLMDAGTDATNILNGNVIPIKLGIIGVVNRSHLHTLEGKRICDAIKDEANFLKTKYPSIAHKHGIPSLARALQRILLSRIETCLPQVRQRIKSTIQHYEHVLESLGEPMENPKKTLIDILTTFATTYCNKITGTHSELETSQLTGGARVSYIFIETYGRTLDGINPLEGLNRGSIITAIRNTNGVRPPFFIPETCFELLVKKQIERLESPSLACVQLIHDELERIITDTESQLSTTMSRFPSLFKKIKSITSDLIKVRVHETNEMVRNLVRIHCSYINTSHPDFVRDKNDILAGLRLGSGDRGLPMLKITSSSTQEHVFDNDPPRECIIVEQLLSSYFNVVKRSIQDTIPKAIMHFLVNHVMERLATDLLSQLYGKEATKMLLEESQSAIQQRKEVTALLKSYQRADQVINDLKETYYD